MIVFKTFLKVLNTCKVHIILYTVILIFFSCFNMTTSNQATGFTLSKPNILIINEDKNKGITKSLIQYLKRNNKHIDIKKTDSAIKDALFYRDVNYIIYIPKKFREDFLHHKNPQIEIESTGDYEASLAEETLKKYMKTANFYNQLGISENSIIKNVEDTLSKQIHVEVASKLDTDGLTKVAFYYNFLNYCILAGCIYVICFILFSFKSEKIKKRTTISSMNYKRFNHKLLLSNGVFTIVLWSFYVILSFILLGNIMFTAHGLLYIINSFIFMICALMIAFLIGNIVRNKEALSGIVNVIALGSSFLCGSFVPMEYLPSSVLKMAHILPSYWYIKTNEILKTIDEINIESIAPIFINMLILLGFILLFIMITNIISLKKQKID